MNLKLESAMFNPVVFFEAGKQKPSNFKMVIDTTQLMAGSSANNQFTLNFNVSFNSNVVIYWGDGTFESISTNTAVIHTYPAPGIYTIKIIVMPGTMHYFNIRYFYHADRNKLLEIKHWGNFLLFTNDFRDCKNLLFTNVQGVIKNFNQFIDGAFFSTKSDRINGIEKWDVSSVIRMNSTFQNASLNQDISAWNFNVNVQLDNFMAGKAPANYNAAYYDNLLNKWANTFIGKGRTQTNKKIGMGTIKYTSAGASARAALVADGWTITDGGQI